MEVNLDIKGSRVFDETYHSDKRVTINRGGTRSSKTYSFCQIAVFWLMTGRISYNCDIPTGILSIVRKSLPSLKATAYRDVIEIIHNHNLYHLIKENKTERTLSFAGRMIEFFSIDDQQKVRSRKRQILFIPEANEIEYRSEFVQLAFRTTDRIYLDFNPDDPDIWINTELEQKRAALKGDVKVIVSNYTWNPFLDSESIAEIEYTKQIDPELWEVFGLGNYGKLTGLIYNNVEVIESFPHCPVVIFGIDFGYNDPMTLVKVGIDERNLYIEELYYERFKIPSDLIKFMENNGLSKNDMYYADSARPGSIQEIQNAGFRGCKPSQKGQNSVADGISNLKKYKWHITAKSKNVLSEVRKYKWQVDNAGDSIEGKPIDGFDHTLDAIRYAVYTHFYVQASIRHASVPQRPQKPLKR